MIKDVDIIVDKDFLINRSLNMLSLDCLSSVYQTFVKII